MICIYFYLLFFRPTCVEDMISPLQFQKRCLLIAQLIHQCAKFVVEFGQNCPKLSPLSLYNLKNFLLEVIRDLTWVLTHAWGIPKAYLPDPISPQGCIESTCSICLQVIELSGSVISHLLDFRVQTFNKCYLLIWFKKTCRHWLNRCPQAVDSLGL